MKTSENIKWGVYTTSGKLIKDGFATKWEARRYAIQHTNLSVWDIVGYKEELYYNIKPVIEFKRRDFDINDNINNIP